MAPRPDPKKVFLIHGRNKRATKEMGIFLRSMGLEPVLFRDVRKNMGGTVHLISVVERGMQEAQGVLALITPDELATLRSDFRMNEDTSEEVERWQARPNVLFEAGMAYGKHPDRVAFVLFGEAKLFSDASGMHVFRPKNEHGPGSSRAQLRGVLASGMGCSVDMYADDWMTLGDFDAVTAGLSEVSPRSPFRAEPKSAPNFREGLLEILRRRTDMHGAVSGTHASIAEQMMGVRPGDVHEGIIHLKDDGLLAGTPYVDTEQFSIRLR
jgi:hypothetical protein